MSAKPKPESEATLAAPSGSANVALNTTKTQPPVALGAATESASDDDIYKRCAEMMQACAKLLQESGREMDDIGDAKHLHEFADKQENLRIQYEEWLNNVSLKDW